MAAASGSILFGAELLLAFALVRALPLGIGAVSTGYLETLQKAAPFSRAVEVVGAGMLILAGVYLLNAYFFWIPWLAG